MATQTNQGLLVTTGQPKPRRRILALMLVPTVITLIGTYCDLFVDDAWFTLGGGYSGVGFLVVIVSLTAYLVWPREVNTLIVDEETLALPNKTKVHRADICATLVLEGATSAGPTFNTVEARGFVVQLVPKKWSGAFARRKRETVPSLEAEMADIPSRFIVMKCSGSWYPKRSDSRVIGRWVGGPLVHRWRDGASETGLSIPDRSEYGEG